MKMWYSNFLQGNSAESYIGSGREYKSAQHIFNQDEIVTSPVISVSFGISNENMQSFQVLIFLGMYHDAQYHDDLRRLLFQS